MNRFKDRVVIVSGGATGMGKEHVKRFASEGASIAIGDVSDASESVRLVQEMGGRVFSAKLDVSSPGSVVEFGQKVIEHFGRADVLINNAGIYPFKSFDAMTFDDWRKVMAVNLDGPFLMSKAFVPAMRLQGRGRIINIASAEAWMTASDNLHYIASKMGVVGFTRALATEAAVDGITVNAIAPGIVANTSINSMMPTYLQELPKLYQAIKRPAQPEDIVNAAIFLASDEASFITGQTLVVDGGAVRL